MTYPQSMRLALTLLTVLALAACGGEPESTASAPVETEDQSILETSHDRCSLDLLVGLGNEFGDGSPLLRDIFSIEDEGRTLLVNPPTERAARGMLYEAVLCVLDEAGAPASVAQKLGATTQQMGPQSETWDEVTFDWSVRSGAELTASFTEE